MTKQKILKMIEKDIDLMIVGFEFDIVHLFGTTLWHAYNASEKEQVAKLFAELVVDDLKETIEVLETNKDLQKQMYKKVGSKPLPEPKEVFPDEPIKVNRTSRGNA